MKLIKKIINNLISKTSGELFCLLRTFFEKLIYNQKRSLFYKNKKYLREFSDPKKLIYFPDKERSRLYSKGYQFRLKSLSDMYLINLIKFNHGDIVIDCGANIGEIKLIFDNLRKRVQYFAFEPGTKEFRCLKKNLSSGKLFNAGLWYKNCSIRFFEKSDTADSSFIENGNYENITYKKVFRLDKFSFKKIKFLKVEAEGAEPEVLLGASNLLKIIEYIAVDCGPERGFNMEKTDKKVIKFLKKNNFKLIKKSKLREVLLFKNLN